MTVEGKHKGGKVDRETYVEFESKDKSSDCTKPNNPTMET